MSCFLTWGIPPLLEDSESTNRVRDRAGVPLPLRVAPSGDFPNSGAQHPTSCARHPAYCANHPTVHAKQRISCAKHPERRNQTTKCLEQSSKENGARPLTSLGKLPASYSSPSNLRGAPSCAIVAATCRVCVGGGACSHVAPLALASRE